MFNDVSEFKRLILCCGYVDLRRGVDGLSAYVRLNYGLDALDKGTLFLFCGRRADRMKGLVFLDYGWCLLMIRLSRGNRFQWPWSPEEARAITPEQFRRLMDGYMIEGTIKETYPQYQRGPAEKYCIVISSGRDPERKIRPFPARVPHGTR